jgi:uncharacterized membrane protein YccC
VLEHAHRWHRHARFDDTSELILLSLHLEDAARLAHKLAESLLALFCVNVERLERLACAERIAIALEQCSKACQALGGRRRKPVFACTQHSHKRIEIDAAADMWCTPFVLQLREVVCSLTHRCTWTLQKCNLRLAGRQGKRTGCRRHEHLVDGRADLVGAVAAAKLLDRLVSAPRQLQRQVDAARAILTLPVRLQWMQLGQGVDC